MFTTVYIGRVLYVEGDGMTGKMEELMPKIRALFEELGLPKEAMSRMREDNWVQLLKEYGAEAVCYRDWVHDQPETKELPVPNSGAQIVLVAKNNLDRYFTLVQKRQDGKIGFPGGASVMWKYNGQTVWEDMRLTADREFIEEVGNRFDGYLVYFDFTTTTNHYPATETSKGWPDVFAPSMYYGSEITFRKLQSYVGDGSDEGTILVIPIDELDKYPWFNNAKNVFKLLKEMYL